MSQYLERINRKLGCETKRKGINLTIVTPKRRVETWNVTSKLWDKYDYILIVAWGFLLSMWWMECMHHASARVSLLELRSQHVFLLLLGTYISILIIIFSIINFFKKIIISTLLFSLITTIYKGLCYCKMIDLIKIII